MAFSDGVFAVAITLLALNIQVPSERITLAALVSRQAAGYATFIVTFAMVGIKWLNHHRMFSLIRQVDTTVNILNLLLLLGVRVVPFTAAPLAKHMTIPMDRRHPSFMARSGPSTGFLARLLSLTHLMGFTEPRSKPLSPALTLPRSPSVEWNPVPRRMILRSPALAR